MRSILSLGAIATLLTLTSAAPSKLHEYRARAIEIAEEYETEIFAKLSDVKRSFRIDNDDVGVEIEEDIPLDAHVPYSQLYKMKDFLPLPADHQDMRVSIPTGSWDTRTELGNDLGNDLGPRDELEARSSILIPNPAVVNALGASNQSPSTSWFSKQSANSIPTLAKSLLKPIIQTQLTTGYAIYTGTGTLSLTSANSGYLTSLTTTPSISRDSGKGGTIGTTHMFIFADSESFTTTTAKKNGNFAGFVSNSVAVDVGVKAAGGNPVTIRDLYGGWATSNGCLRNFVPFTTGEQAYNQQVTGGRIAIWPDSSIIPLTSTTALQYAPLVFINTTSGVQFDSFGTTMYTISIPNARSGPAANRIAPRMFTSSQMEWGVVGGLRSWGSDGIGGVQGWVYLFANDQYGLYASRVRATDIDDLSAYQYYWPSLSTWSSTIIPPGSSKQVFLSGSYSASDIFYSPIHKTFINVYADRYIDNKFLWRYLMAPSALTPGYDGKDFASNILKYSWSAPETLYQAPVPGNGNYIYAQGVQLGYFGTADISNGGLYMLITWTAPTGASAASLDTSYEFQSARVRWG